MAWLTGEQGQHCRLCGDFKSMDCFSFRNDTKKYRTECKPCHHKAKSSHVKKTSKTHRAVCKNTILVIPDQHAPYHHPDTIAFLKHVKEVYNPTRIVNLGDEVDNHAISFHDNDPDLDSAAVELVKAREFIAQLAALFPKMDIMDSNHGSLLYRRGKHHGIPKAMLRGYREVLGAPDGWEWHHELVIDGILFHHGDGKKALVQNTIRDEMMSVVQGHHHSQFGIYYHQTSQKTVFGVSCGCLIDDKSLAFAYNKKTSKRPVIGCCVIISGHPMLIRMKVDENNRWIGDL